MKIKVTIMTLLLAFIASFSYATDAANAEFDNVQYEAAYSLQLDNVEVLDIAIFEEDDECTVTVEVDIAGSGGSISATADTCAEAVAQVKEGLEAIAE